MFPSRYVPSIIYRRMTNELPEKIVYNEHVVKAFFHSWEGSEEYKEMQKFIHDRRNGVVRKCDPDNIDDVV